MVHWFWPSNFKENFAHGRISFGTVQNEKENGALCRLHVAVHCFSTLGAFSAQIRASLLLLGL
jgi:hypothetical protein